MAHITYWCNSICHFQTIYKVLILFLASALMETMSRLTKKKTCISNILFLLFMYMHLLTEVLPVFYHYFSVRQRGTVSFICSTVRKARQ